MSPEQRLAQLGYELPAPATPAYQYVAVVVHQGVAHISGQIPRKGAEVLMTGKVGADISVASAQVAARACALQAISALKQALGDLTRVERVLKVTGFVASAAGFNQQPQVIDAASSLLVEVFGEAGRHARSAIGVAELPRGVPVEVEMSVAVRD